MLKWVILSLSSIGIIFIHQYPNVAPLFASRPSGYVYAFQNPFFDPWDINVYAATIRYGQREGIFYPNLYTTVPNSPVLVYTFHTLLGFFAKSIDPFLLFHLSAVIAGTLLILGMYWAIRSVGFSFRKTLFLLFLITLGGGLGFLGPEWFSADITDSSFTFQSTFQKGHEAIAILGYITALVLFYHLCITKKITLLTFVILIASLGVSIFIYPYFVVSFFLIAGITVVTFAFKDPNKIIIPVSTIFLSALLIALFAFQQFLINPTYLSTGSHLSISIISVFMGFGIFTILYFYYLFSVPKSSLGVFLLLWIGITFILAILPFGPGKIFFRGSFFPLVLLGVLTLEHLVKHTPSLQKQIIYILFFLFTIATSITIFKTRMIYISQPFPYTYIHEDEDAIMNFLSRSTPPDSGVLTNYQLSNQIPAFTHNRVFLGHMLTTPNSEKKTKEFAAFITGSGTVEEKKDFLLKNHISYLVWGPAEQVFYDENKQKNNAILEYLKTVKKVYANKNFTIYEINER